MNVFEDCKNEIEKEETRGCECGDCCYLKEDPWGMSCGITGKAVSETDFCSRGMKSLCGGCADSAEDVRPV